MHSKDGFRKYRPWDAVLLTEDQEYIQKLILMWLPCLLVWALSSFKVYYNVKSRRKQVPQTWNFLARFFVKALLFLLSLVDLATFILDHLSDVAVYNLDFMRSSSIEVFTLISALMMLFHEDETNAKTSVWSWRFWLLCLCELLQHSHLSCRSQEEVGSLQESISCLIYYPLLILLFLLNCATDSKFIHLEYSTTNQCLRSPPSLCGTPAKHSQKFMSLQVERLPDSSWMEDPTISEIYDQSCHDDYPESVESDDEVDITNNSISCCHDDYPESVESDDEVDITNNSISSAYTPIPREKKKLQQMVIQLVHDVPLQHQIERGAGTRYLSSIEKRDFEELAELKSGKFSEEEHEQIRKNWREFCQLHNWDPENFKPFLQMRLRDRHFTMDYSNRMKFVQFLAKDLPNRSLYSVYQSFKVMSEPHKKSRYSVDEDKTILKFMSRVEEGENDGDRSFADLALILNRTRASVWRRHRLLRKKQGETE